MTLILYLLTIVVSNVVTVIIPPTDLGILVIPPSAYFMGFSFIFGNLLQDRYGKGVSRWFIWVGLAISAVLFQLLELSQVVIVASSIAFLVSQFLSNFLYDLFKKLPISNHAMLLSSVIGSLVDVTLFVTIGLSPLGLNVLQGINILLAIVGQFIVQTILQIIAKKLLFKFYATKNTYKEN